jgi:hypothetical protein
MPRITQAVVAIDGTPFRRGKKVRAAGWFHDRSAAVPAKTGYRINWVIAAIVVRPPFLNRPVAVPVPAEPVIKDTTCASRALAGPPHGLDDRTGAALAAKLRRVIIAVRFRPSRPAGTRRNQHHLPGLGRLVLYKPGQQSLFQGRPRMGRFLIPSCQCRVDIKYRRYRP